MKTIIIQIGLVILMINRVQQNNYHQGNDGYKNYRKGTRKETILKLHSYYNKALKKLYMF